jgi:hypothetical protein
MEALRANRPTLDGVRHMPVGDLVALPAEDLALLQADAREVVETAKRMQDWIEAAVALRFGRRAASVRADAGKDTGTVRFRDGAVEITAELAERVERDQARLVALVERIRAGGEDPGEYVEFSVKVPERAYAAWPERIHQAFEPARTVRAGRQTFRPALDPEVA